jgi:erythromycin esterase
MRRSVMCLALVFSSTGMAHQSAATPPVDPISWAVKHAVAFDHPQALTPIIQQARVIGLAEYTHGQPEGLALRNQLFQYWIRTRGVTAIAAETSFIKSIAIDDYVQGRSSAQPAPDVVQGVFARCPLQIVENRQLIEWLREYNALPTTRRPVRFYGIDLTGAHFPDKDVFADARQTADAALGFVERLDPVLATQLAARLQPGLAHFSTVSYPKLAVTERDALTAALQDLRNLFKQHYPSWLNRTSAEAYWRASQSAQVALQHDADFRADDAARESGAPREAAMLENLTWVLEREGEQGKVLLFASLEHLTRGPNPRYQGNTLGARLAAALGNSYVPIASHWQPKEPVVSESAVKDATTLIDPLFTVIAQRLPRLPSLLQLSQRPFDSRWTHTDNPSVSFVDAVIFIQATAPEYPF